MPQRLDHLALQEIEALQEVKRARVSRVANLLDHLKGSDGSTNLVLEYATDCCKLCRIHSKGAEGLISAAD